MRKRLVSLVLAAALASALCIPCAADIKVPKSREYPYPGIPDVATSSAAYPSIRRCYETELMNGKTASSFDPQGKLTLGQLLVLCSRLYSLRHGRGATIPALPASADQFVRFYDNTDTQVGDLSAVHSMSCDAFQLRFTFRDGALTGQPRTVRVGLDDGILASAQGSYTPSATVLAELPIHPGSGSTTTFAYATPPEQAKPLFDAVSAFLTEVASAKADGRWGRWWYPAYLDLFYRQGLTPLNLQQLQSASMSAPATRNDLAYLIRAVLGTDLKYTHAYFTVPDLSPSLYTAEQIHAIEDLYQAGILNGVDASGSFRGSGTLTRAQTAMILARAMDPQYRI